MALMGEVAKMPLKRMSWEWLVQLPDGTQLIGRDAAEVVARWCHLSGWLTGETLAAPVLKGNVLRYLEGAFGVVLDPALADAPDAEFLEALGATGVVQVVAK